MTWAAQDASGPPLLAGFECGRLHWNGHDLLHSTGHLPNGRMQHHYATALAEGAGGARDGLSWRHDVVERIQAVPAGFPVIWDFAHFDLPPRPAQHALACATALPPNSWAIAVNEPSVGRRVSGVIRSRAVKAALRMMTTVAMLPNRPRFATCDPFHHLHPEVFRATDQLVASGLIEMVGVNYYPHHAIEPLHHVLRVVADRWRLPVMITETGWHDGLHAAHRRFPHIHDRWGKRRCAACSPSCQPVSVIITGWHDGLHAAHRRFPHIHDRWGWLAHVRSEVERSGVPVAGICWYPWLDMPDWGDPHRGRWPCGWPGRQA